MPLSWHAAVDLGASGGRVGLGALDRGRLELEVVHRFPNEPVRAGSGLYWDAHGLWQQVLRGLRLAGQRARERGGRVASVGVDSWAVDFALLDEHGLILDGVRHYRDPRTRGLMRDTVEQIGRERLYELTGTQFLSFNTVYQLLAVRRDTPGLLARARKLLMVPDLMHCWLCGSSVGELTNASTTGLLDPRTRRWSQPVLDALELPSHFLPEVVEPGTVLGPLTPEVQRDTHLDGAVVVAVATHDTASAVAAVASRAPGQAYLSSGTWSLVGVQTRQPVLTPAALDAGLSNEAGIGGTTRLLKNVAGLWILQECRRAWNEPDYPELYAAAEAAAPGGPTFDPNDPRLLAPGADMPERVRSLCRERGQRAPDTRGEIVRSILESLALAYAPVLVQLERATSTPITTLHVVGGGARAVLLNRLTAEATGRQVIAGPADATLAGNLLVQAAAFDAPASNHPPFLRIGRT